MNIKKLLPFVLGLATFTLATPAFADTYSQNFESFTLGTVNGQDGWSMTGPYDVEVDGSFGHAAFGTKSLRISDAVTSGSFGDWVLQNL